MQQLVQQLGLHGTYPDTWDEFVGQERAKRQLRIACQSAAQRNAALGHVMLASEQPGIGKTTLGLLIGWELGTQVKIASGQIDANQARILLAGMNDRDVLFLDEMHRMVFGGKGKAEWLLHLLQDGVIIGPRGPEPMPKVTIVGATTDLSRLPETITSRFGLRPQLEPYSEQEAIEIAATMARRILPAALPFPSFDDLRDIVTAASRNPRTISALLANVRDLATVQLEEVHDGSRYHLAEAFEWLGLTPDGFSMRELEYLRVLVEDFGGQAGERALRDRMREDVTYLERSLLDKGMISRTARGRVITAEGIRRVFEMKAAA